MDDLMYYQDVLARARASKDYSLLKTSETFLSSGRLTYRYQLRHKNHFRLKYYYGDVSNLIEMIKQEINTGVVALQHVGYVEGNSYFFQVGTLYNYWKLSLVPTLTIGNSIVALKVGPMSPYFKVDKKILHRILETAGKESETFKNLNKKLREEQRQATLSLREKEQEESTKRLRQHRLQVFKEALKIDPKSAIAYQNSVKTDPEFTRITAILLEKQGDKSIS